MKVVKELPLYILNSLRLSAIPQSRLIRRDKEQLPVVVSLTSIESRLTSLHLVIRSLLTQSHLPQKIVLWLNHDLKSRIPKSLSKLQSDLFEIRYTKLKSSHKKLIHSLEAFPDKVIITCDDDLMYRKDWLYLLYTNHLSYPDRIIGNTTLHINFDEEGKVLPSKQWRSANTEEINDKAFVAIGAWGILYPPGSLNDKVLDSDLFMKLAPYSDDFWFKAMGQLNGTKTMQAEITPKEPIPIAGTQKVSLKKLNLGMEKNDMQWKALSEHFGLNDLIKS